MLLRNCKALQNWPQAIAPLHLPSPIFEECWNHLFWGQTTLGSNPTSLTSSVTLGKWFNLYASVSLYGNSAHFVGSLLRIELILVTHLEQCPALSEHKLLIQDTLATMELHTAYVLSFLLPWFTPPTEVSPPQRGFPWPPYFTQPLPLLLYPALYFSSQFSSLPIALLFICWLFLPLKRKLHGSRASVLSMCTSHT